MSKEREKPTAFDVAGTTPYLRHLGIELVEISAGRAVMKLPMKDELRQPYGLLHGGATASLIDTATAFAVVASIGTEDKATTVDLTLSANALRLQSVVVSGVSDPTSGVKMPVVVAQLKAEDIPVPSTGSAASMLKGKVAGVTVRSGSSPGSEPQVQLRNPLSVRSGTGPMYIVDGVIMNDAFSGSTHEIDPSDIATIEIIKGAAAAALYGSKAGNGVITITTNRGQNIPQDEARYTMRSELGFSRLGHRIPLTTHHRWLVNADNQYIDAAGNVVERSQRIIDPNGFVDNEYGGPTYDRLKQFFGTGLSAVVDDLGVPVVRDPPTRVGEPTAPVEVLGVHEELLVQGADLIQRLSAHHPEAAGQHVDIGCHRVIVECDARNQPVDGHRAEDAARQ